MHLHNSGRAARRGSVHAARGPRWKHRAWGQSRQRLPAATRLALWKRSLVSLMHRDLPTAFCRAGTRSSELSAFLCPISPESASYEMLWLQGFACMRHPLTFMKCSSHQTIAASKDSKAGQPNPDSQAPPFAITPFAWSRRVTPSSPPRSPVSTIVTPRVSRLRRSSAKELAVVASMPTTARRSSSRKRRAAAVAAAAAAARPPRPPSSSGSRPAAAMRSGMERAPSSAAVALSRLPISTMDPKKTYPIQPRPCTRMRACNCVTATLHPATLGTVVGSGKASQGGAKPCTVPRGPLAETHTSWSGERPGTPYQQTGQQISRTLPGHFPSS